MISVSAVLDVHGVSFSPRVAEARLGRAIEGEKVEPRPPQGATSGATEGSLIIEYSWDCAREPSFESGVSDLLPASLPIFADSQFIPTLRASGAEEITLYVNVSYSEQCNIELSPSLLSALAGLGVTLAITCYEG